MISRGRVIGINSNKIGGSTVEGMGYAIPISSAKPIIEELMNQETKEKVDEGNRGFLGISCINVTKAMAMPMECRRVSMWPRFMPEPARTTRAW